MTPIKPISFLHEAGLPKGWGREVLIVNHAAKYNNNFPTGYSGKLLVYDKAGATSSMHYHVIKHETFYVLCGKFLLTYYDLNNADSQVKPLEAGDVVIIPPSNPHRLQCVTPGTIVEFATTDYSDDNYRIMKGDSQYPKVEKCTCTAERGPCECTQAYDESPISK